jgi:undecaprenyl-diphosphatase
MQTMGRWLRSGAQLTFSIVAPAWAIESRRRPVFSLTEGFDLDVGLFHAINGLAGHVDGFDDSFAWISQFGPFVLVAGLIALWFWPGTRASRDERQWAVTAATLSACLGMGVNQIIVRVWVRQPPYLDHHAHPLLAPKYQSSFPSDHATFAFALAVSIALVSRRCGIVALKVAALIAFSRAYLGEHAVSDVLM